MNGKLFDTNVLLWFLAGDKRLPSAIRQSIEDPFGKKYMSIASAWEVAIKISLGKLELEGGAEAFWRVFTDGGFEGLPVSIEAVKRVQTLPFHHKDPFDRILIATAIELGLEIVTSDGEFAKYR